MIAHPRGSRTAVWGVPAGVCVAVFGVAAFVFRTLSVVDLANDHYMTLGWAQQVLFGEWPGLDFVDPGMPLSYLPSALVQWRWPGPLSELLLTSALLAAAAAVTLVAAARLSGSWVVGTLAALLELAFHPTLHSFHKILTPAVAILLVQGYARAPSRARLWWLGLWTATAALFRHDLGVYTGLAVVAALAAIHAPHLGVFARALRTAVAGGAVLFVPYAAYVQWATGWPEHLRRALEFGRSDAHQIFADLPRVADAAQWNRDGAVAFLFYATHAMLAAGLVALFARRGSETRERLAAGAASVTALAAFLPVILRQPVDGRLTDLAGVFSLTFAWLAGQAIAIVRETRLTRGLAASLATAAGSAAAGALVVVSVWTLGQVGEQIDSTGIYGGWRGVRETWADRIDRGATWPWERAWPSREMPRAVLYLRACTTPDAAVLLTWPAPEYNFFARRRFAAGHVELLPPGAFTTAEDQRQMLDHLSRQFVPIVLINQDRYGEFAAAYPRLAAYVAERYERFAEFTLYDGATVALAAQAGLTPGRTWGPDAWPCGHEPSSGR